MPTSSPVMSAARRGRAIGLLGHDLSDQAIKGFDGLHSNRRFWRAGHEARGIRHRIRKEQYEVRMPGELLRSFGKPDTNSIDDSIAPLTHAARVLASY